MTIRISIILGIIFSLGIVQAQDNLPLNSDVEYEVRADSLLKSNQSQNLQVTIACNSSGGLDFYEIKVYDLKVFWTLVSATLNDQPVWLVNSNSRSDNNKVLAWYYNAEQNLLRLYPSEWNGTYRLDLTITASILQPAKLSTISSKLISLQAELGGQKYECVPVGSGGEMTFKRKTQRNR